MRYKSRAQKTSKYSPHPATLITIPYDIRYLIYTHLFPPKNTEIPLHLHRSEDRILNRLKIHPSHKSRIEIPISLLRTFRLLHAEAAAYLYNTTIFSITDPKTDILNTHGALLDTVKKHGRGEVHVDFFSDESRPKKGCVVMYTGNNKPDEVVRRSERGVPVSKEEFAANVAREIRQRPKTRSNEVGWGWYCALGMLVVAVLGGVIGAIVYANTSP